MLKWFYGNGMGLRRMIEDQRWLCKEPLCVQARISQPYRENIRLFNIIYCLYPPAEVVNWLNCDHESVRTEGETADRSPVPIVCVMLWGD